MTQKEKENVLMALSNIRSAIGELEYYKKSDWINDESALYLVQSAKTALEKCITKKKKAV